MPAPTDASWPTGLRSQNRRPAHDNYLFDAVLLDFDPPAHGIHLHELDAILPLTFGKRKIDRRSRGGWIENQQRHLIPEQAGGAGQLNRVGAYRTKAGQQQTGTERQGDFHFRKEKAGADEPAPAVSNNKYYGVIVPPTEARNEIISPRRMAVAPLVLLFSISLSMLPMITGLPGVLTPSKTPRMVPAVL